MFPESYFNSCPKGVAKRPPKHYVKKKSDKSYMTMRMTVVIVAIKMRISETFLKAVGNVHNC